MLHFKWEDPQNTTKDLNKVKACKNKIGLLGGFFNIIKIFGGHLLDKIEIFLL